MHLPSHSLISGKIDTETADRYNNEKGDNNRYHPTHVEATFTSTRPVYVIMNLFPHRNLLNPGVPNGTYGSSEYRRQTSYDPYSSDSQIMIGLPTIWSSGTKPQERLSALLWRLSPIIQ